MLTTILGQPPVPVISRGADYNAQSPSSRYAALKLTHVHVTYTHVHYTYTWYQLLTHTGHSCRGRLSPTPASSGLREGRGE